MPKVTDCKAQAEMIAERLYSMLGHKWHQVFDAHPKMLGEIVLEAFNLEDELDILCMSNHCPLTDDRYQKAINEICCMTLCNDCLAKIRPIVNEANGLTS